MIAGGATAVLADATLRVLADVIALAVVAGLGVARQWLGARLDRADPRLWPGSLVMILAVWALANLIAMTLQWGHPVVVFALTSIVVGWILWNDLGRLWRVGVHGADLAIGGGLSYTDALKLPRNRLDFMGTGASKLTSSGAFDDAIRRCQRPDRPVRFLLLDPHAGAAHLSDAARQAGADRDAYMHRVQESLRHLATLRIERRYSIRVRFYERPAPFRLMFIDDSLCLVSYNVYGEGDGSQLPQLHLVSAAQHRDVETFYYPFFRYFEDVWSVAKDWDFRQGLS